MRRIWVPTLVCVTLALMFWQMPVRGLQAGRGDAIEAAPAGDKLISGTITDAISGAPLPFAFVLVERTDGGKRNGQADRSGDYAISGLTEGDYLLTAFAPNYVPGALPDTIHIDGVTAHFIDFALEPVPTGGLFGNVRRMEDSTPIVDIHVRLIATDHCGTAKTRTEADGSYEFESVPAGTYELIVSGAGWGNVEWGAPVEIIPDVGSGPYDFYLPAAAGTDAIAGIASGPGGQLPGAEIYALTASPAGDLLVSETHSLGDYTLRAASPGYLYVWARRYDQRAAWFGSATGFDWAQPVRAPQADVDLVLSPRVFGPWSIGGTVTRYGAPLDAGIVTARDASGEIVDISPIWPGGRYIIADLPSGDYDLTLVSIADGAAEKPMGKVHVDRDFFCGFDFKDDLTAVRGDAVRPEAIETGNYPNPFNPSTSIYFVNQADGYVNVSIYNTLGQRVRTLADGHYAAGKQTVTWDGTDDRGRALPSGTYFYRVTTPHGIEGRKMLLLK